MAGALDGVQVQGRAQSRMSGKRQFLRDREYADLFPFPSLGGRVTR